MNKADKFNLNKYYKYLNFIEECKNKIYDKELVLHEHHIRPKHMCYDLNLIESDANKVMLSVEDHITAHLMLSDMYEEGEYEYISNLRSARLLNKKSIKNKNVLNKISKTYKGENNPAKKKISKKNIKKGLKRYYQKNKHHALGKTYEEIYGKEGAKLEKNKRSKKTRTDEEYKKASKKISKTIKENGSLAGSNNPMAKEIKVDDVYYGSVSEALTDLKISRYKLYKYHKIKEVKNEGN